MSLASQKSKMNKQKSRLRHLCWHHEFVDDLAGFSRRDIRKECDNSPIDWVRQRRRQLDEMNHLLGAILLAAEIAVAVVFVAAAAAVVIVVVASVIAAIVAAAVAAVKGKKWEKFSRLSNWLFWISIIVGLNQIKQNSLD